MRSDGNQERYYDEAMRAYPRAVRALYSLVLGVLFAVSRLLWRWRVEGAEALTPPGATGSVIICNHTSMAEVIAIVAHLWRSGRRVRPIFKSEFNRVAIVRWVYARAGGIPVGRGTADLRALRRAQRALARGEDVLIFPEGTRVRRDDQPVEVHGGFALIAQMAKAGIAPMAVCGFRDITPVGKRMFRPVKTWIRCAARLDPEQVPATLKRSERVAWMEREAIARMYAARDELRREHPGRR